MRGLAPILLGSLALVAVLGCASGGLPAGGAAPAAPESRTSRQLMVTLAPAPVPFWNRLTVELAVQHDLRTVFAWSLGSLGERCIVYETRNNSRKIEEVVERMRRDPRVRSVEAIQTFETLALPEAPPSPRHGDPYANLQRGAHAMGVDQAHRWATGRGVKVAVIDTGVDLDHPDLRGRIVKANNFVDRGEQTFTNDIHGTAVAGALAASEGNEVGIAGTAPEAEIFALKACWPQPAGSRRAICDSYTLAKAIDFAILEHAQILNFSLAGPSDPLLGRMIKAALDRGIAVVAAAPDGAGPDFPASVEGVLAVLSSDPDGNLRSPSTSPRAMLAAPGVDILTTVPHGSYDFFTGSSLAAAEVSGVAALLLERNPKLTPAQLGALIRKTARPLRLPPGEPDPPVFLVDACAAVSQVMPGVTCAR
ncbi:MAG TPA: S8 family serine peptidase [Thermoanaerobaculia bacterium]|nr:S8 family serine peptidase [Thermoanaerobaculia bacterium]